MERDLGLSTARWIIEGHGGRVRLQKRPRLPADGNPA